MSTNKKIPFDLGIIASTFPLERTATCAHLDQWLAGEFELTTPEQQLLRNCFKSPRRFFDVMFVRMLDVITGYDFSPA